ncbi:MAG: hypothetical protein PQJ60_06040 [Spirochaetales bacterium]|nr:hypothetical protein [Spirochaetales bacterium]
MTVHVLGGGNGQLSLIRRLSERGHKTVVSDQNPQAPGFSYAHRISHASSFDADRVIRDALRFGSDFFITAGTDQPVLTAALASERLGKPFFLTPEQALMVTNKRVMKRAMTGAGLPHRKYTLLKKNFSRETLDKLTFPLVLKPLDSQGQRGVLKVDSIGEIREQFDYVLSFSRADEILAEEYYPRAQEITISGWCHEGRARILSLTDRVTVDNGPHLGVCIAHRYPSLRFGDEEILEGYVQGISDMIGLKKGPLYIQILHGDQGYSINEIACRLGGAYEDIFIPWLCGIPLLDYLIEMTLGEAYNEELLSHLREVGKRKRLSLEMFFYRPGLVAEQRGMESLKGLEGILGGDFLLPPGTEITSRKNSTQRAGYFIATSGEEKSLERLVEEAYRSLTVRDEKGGDMLWRF